MQKHQPTDQRRFVTWLDATFIVGSILAIGMLAMAWAGYNSVGPDAAIRRLPGLRPSRINQR